MKRQTRRLALRTETVRQPSAAELSGPRGGFIAWSDLFCPASWMHTCGDSCTADLSTG